MGREGADWLMMVPGPQRTGLIYGLMLLLAVILVGCPIIFHDPCLKTAERAENSCG